MSDMNDQNNTSKWTIPTDARSAILYIIGTCIVALITIIWDMKTDLAILNTKQEIIGTTQKTVIDDLNQLQASEEERMKKVTALLEELIEATKKLREK